MRVLKAKMASWVQVGIQPISTDEMQNTIRISFQIFEEARSEKQVKNTWNYAARSTGCDDVNEENINEDVNDALTRALN